MALNIIDIVISEKIFGIMDSAPNTKEPAYLDFDLANKDKWVAEISNYTKKRLKFTPVDNRLELMRDDGTYQKRCDALLYFNKKNDRTIIFIELKERSDYNWKRDADEQLCETIATFEKTNEARLFKTKRAHIANNLRPKFNKDDKPRIKGFFNRTRYALSISKTVLIE
jgi:hypothetical protein